MMFQTVNNFLVKTRMVCHSRNMKPPETFGQLVATIFGSTVHNATSVLKTGGKLTKFQFIYYP